MVRVAALDVGLLLMAVCDDLAGAFQHQPLRPRHENAVSSPSLDCLELDFVVDCVMSGIKHLASALQLAYAASKHQLFGK